MGLHNQARAIALAKEDEFSKNQARAIALAKEDEFSKKRPILKIN